MAKSLQKSANRIYEINLPHPGILDAEFDQRFQLRCYRPSTNLRPFLIHIFTQRLRYAQSGQMHRPLEILSGPNVYLFFTSRGAFIHKITNGIFEYDANEDVIAGVKFRPGAFRSFFGRPLSELRNNNSPLTEIFPGTDQLFCQILLAQPDETIIAQVEAMLSSNVPTYDKNIESIEKIMARLEADDVSTIEQLACVLGKSERSLQLLFHDYVGVGLKWVIVRKRLLRTVHRIHSTPRLTWTRAAIEAGYSTQSHFSNEFKEVLGMSPSEYLKNKPDHYAKYRTGT